MTIAVDLGRKATKTNKSLILDVASPRTHKPKIENESLDGLFHFIYVHVVYIVIQFSL